MKIKCGGNCDVCDRRAACAKLGEINKMSVEEGNEVLKALTAGLPADMTGDVLKDAPTPFTLDGGLNTSIPDKVTPETGDDERVLNAKSDDDEDVQVVDIRRSAKRTLRRATVSCTLTVEDAVRINAMCKDTGMNASEVLETLLLYALEHASIRKVRVTRKEIAFK